MLGDRRSLRAEPIVEEHGELVRLPFDWFQCRGSVRRGVHGSGLDGHSKKTLKAALEAVDQQLRGDTVRAPKGLIIYPPA